ncbi:lipopolysaccharide biosynthesis protein [Tropicimonas sp. IMCC6043]|uniref:lipopolysaccharide biosynthesis protein n=1 Tax=Tropicimonas sp. IMCC6043 TaxID=2510645 RepID=UPI00101DDCC9|nr:oligosaccharide flippase family protein [Tropicimonas sp. IMCC6043]RYH07470.1 hypothetical protein EU800_19995 [Tropicimonas sp. IMCC6043]
MAPLTIMTAIAGIQAIGAALTFATILLLTALLGPELYGRYAWVISAGGLASILLKRGYQTTLVTDFAPLDLDADRRPAPVANTYALYICGTLVAFAIAIFAGPAVATLARPELLWVAPIGAAVSAQTIADGILRAADRGTRSQFVTQILRTAFLLAGFGLLAVSGSRSVAAFLAVYALASLVAALVYVLPLLPEALRNRFRGGLVRGNAAHFQVAVSRSIGAHLPVFVTGFFVEMDQLAYLAIALRFSNPISFGVIASRAFYGAKINRHVRSGALRLAQEDFRMAARFSFAVALLAAVGVLVLIYGLSLLQMGPLAGFEDKGLLFLTLCLVSLHQLGLSAFGPVQLTAIQLGTERYVRNLNLAMIAALAVGLVLAGLSGKVWISAVVLVGYGFGISFGLAARTRAEFRRQLG